MKKARFLAVFAALAVPAIAAEQTPEQMRLEIEAEYQRLKDAQEPRRPATASTGRPASASAPSPGARYYSTAELHRMVASGAYPDQAVSTEESSPSDFRSCLAALDLARSRYAAYPSAVIVSTAIARIEKFWMNQAAVLITCSAVDQKMLITTSRYR